MQYMPLKTKQNQPALNFNQANLWDKMRQHDWLRFHNVQIYVFNKVLVSIMQQNLDKCFFSVFINFWFCYVQDGYCTRPDRWLRLIEWRIDFHQPRGFSLTFQRLSNVFKVFKVPVIIIQSNPKSIHRPSNQATKQPSSQAPSLSLSLSLFLSFFLSVSYLHGTNVDSIDFSVSFPRRYSYFQQSTNPFGCEYIPRRLATDSSIGVDGIHSIRVASFLQLLSRSIASARNHSSPDSNNCASPRCGCVSYGFKIGVAWWVALFLLHFQPAQTQTRNRKQTNKKKATGNQSILKSRYSRHPHAVNLVSAHIAIPSSFRIDNTFQSLENGSVSELEVNSS